MNLTDIDPLLSSTTPLLSVSHLIWPNLNLVLEWDRSIITREYVRRREVASGAEYRRAARVNVSASLERADSTDYVKDARFVPGIDPEHAAGACG